MRNRDLKEFWDKKTKRSVLKIGKKNSETEKELSNNASATVNAEAKATPNNSGSKEDSGMKKGGRVPSEAKATKKGSSKKGGASKEKRQISGGTTSNKSKTVEPTKRQGWKESFAVASTNSKFMAAHDNTIEFRRKGKAQKESTKKKISRALTKAGKKVRKVASKAAVKAGGAVGYAAGRFNDPDSYKNSKADKAIGAGEKALNGLLNKATPGTRLKMAAAGAKGAVKGAVDREKSMAKKKAKKG